MIAPKGIPPAEEQTMKYIHTTALALALSIAAGPALAWHQSYASYGPIYDYARVTRVDRVVDRSRYPVNNEVCYDEPVSRYRPGTTYYHRDTTGPTVLGALVGGALGNQVGKGDGRKAATIAGAVVGGAIGNNSSHDGRTYSETETRCRTVDNGYEERRVVGYDVEYRYRGETYMSSSSCAAEATRSNSRKRPRGGESRCRWCGHMSRSKPPPNQPMSPISVW